MKCLNLFSNLAFKLLSIYVCVWFVCLHVCSHMYGHMNMLVHVYADQECIILHPCLFFPLTEAWSVTETETNSASPGDLFAPEIPPTPVPPPRSGMKYARTLLVVYVVLGIWTLVLTLVQQGLYHWAISWVNLNICNTFISIYYLFSVCLSYLHFGFYTKELTLTRFWQKANILKKPIVLFHRVQGKVKKGKGSDRI